MAVLVIVGPGAVGVALASELQAAGMQARLWGRNGPQAFRGELLADRMHELDLPVLSEAEKSQVQGVFVAVKSFDLKAALADCLPQMPRKIPVVPVGNGSVEPTLKSFASAHPDLIWRLGFCTFGVSKVGASRYAMRSKTGRCVFGPFLPEDAAPSDWEKTIAERRGLFEWQKGIVRLARRKWLFNTAVNSLAAVHHLPSNGDLLNDAVMLSAVFNEAYDLGEELWGPWPQGRSEVYGIMLKLIEDTAANENSMARDARLGRRTETNELAGLAEGRSRYALLNELHKKLKAMASS